MKKFIPNMLAVLSVLFITLVFLPQTAMAKAWKAYVVEDDTTLTFYYDAKWGTRPGTTYDINDRRTDDAKYPAWAGNTRTPNARITKVVFDSSFKAYKPTKTTNWFYNCTKVVSFEGMENLCTDQVTEMPWMFAACQSLKTIDVSYFNTAKVKDMTAMFAGCSKLTTIYCDEDWNDGTKRGQLMFNACDNLLGVTHFQDGKVHEDMANAATGYFTSKAYVVLNDGTLTFYYGTDRATRTGSKYGIYETWSNIEGLEDYPIWTIREDVIERVIFDRSFKVFKPTTTKKWFSGFGYLKSILGEENLCTDRVTTMKGMFQNCSSLSSIIVKDFNTSNVTDMSAMFSGCSSLKTLDVSNFDVSKVTNMREMFYGCTALEKIFCNDDWNSSVLQDGTSMFLGCTSLQGQASYTSQKTGASMANPTDGYFKNKLYVIYYENTLTFYNDVYKGVSHPGAVYFFDENLPDDKSPAWLAQQKNVTTVVFDPSFKTVRPTTMMSWFYGFENLTTIEGMENLCTDSVVNMAFTFSRCSSLTSIDLSHFNTENVKVMQSMFDGCSALTTLDVSNFDMSKMINTETMFRNCTALTTIYSSDDWNSSTLENSFLMFENCTKLKGAVAYNADNTGASMANPTTGYFTAKTYVEYKDNTLTFYCDNLKATREGTVYVLDENLPDDKSPAWLAQQKNVTKVVFDSSFKDSRPTTMMLWFYGFENLTTIEGMEYLCTDSVVNMYSTFSGCSSLTSIDLSHFNTENVIVMAFMFEGCRALTTLDVSSFDMSKMINMESMFHECTALTTIYGNEDWDICSSTWEDGTGMFLSCTNLKGAVEYNSFYTGSSMANPTTGYFTKTAYVVENNGTLTFYCDTKRASRTGTSYNIYDKNKSDSYTPIWAGRSTSENTSIKKVVFDSSFKNYKPTSTNYWFSYCTNLQTIEGLSNLNTEDVTDMVGMFNNCRNLTTVDVSLFNTTKVTNMRDMFNGCVALKSLDLSSFNTANVTDMSYMFVVCSALTSIDMSNFNTENVTDMSYMFGYCSSLKKLNLSNFNTAKVTKMDFMFSGCSSLTTIFSNDDWMIDGKDISSDEMFDGCTSLTGAVAYDASKYYVSMANPTKGYFTSKVYAVRDGSTLTFYYDENRKSHTGTPIYTITADYDECPAWADNREIQKVVFDSSFKDYKPTTTKGWFYALEELETIEGIENLNTEQVTSMEYMFYYTPTLETIDLTHFNTANVTNMYGMFQDSPKLRTLDLSSFNTEKVTDMASMFSGCFALTTIYCNDNWNSGVVKNSSGMFNACENLKGAVAYDMKKLYVSMANPTKGYFTIRLRGKIGKGGYATFAVGDVQGTMSDNVEIFTATRNDGKVVLTSRTDYNLPVDGCVMLKGTPGETFTFTGNASANPKAMPEGQVLTGGSNPYTVTASDDIFALATIDGTSAFYRVKTGVVIPAHKAYLSLTGAGAKSLTMVEMGDETTAIDSVTDSQEQSSAIYNLAGQRVEKMQRGIYIVNGKKVLKK